MKGPISLAQELRAIRNGNHLAALKDAPEPGESERPWQADIDRLQQTLHEVLQAVSHLSGVELQAVGRDPQSAGESLPQIDCRTLKDRIRNDLEAFSVTTAATMARQAEEQARTALGAIQNEVQGRIDQIAGEFQEKLQSRVQPEQLETDLAQQSKDRVAELVQAQTDEFARWVWLTCKGTGTPIPVQVEKLLEPYAEEASARFAGSFRQRVQDLLAEQERLAQESLQGTADSLKSQVSMIEQASLQACEQNADAATKQSIDRLNAAANEAAKSFEGRIGGEIEASLGRFQTRLEAMVATSREGLRRAQDLQAEGFSRKLEEMASTVQEKRVSEIAGRVEQTAADVIESSVQHLHQQAADSLEHSREELKSFLQIQMQEVRERAMGLGRSAHESLARDASKLAEGLRGLDRELAAIEKKHIAASEEQLSTLIQGTMESLTGRIRQIADTQMEEINRFVRESQDKAASQYESQLREATEGHYNNLLERIHKEAEEAGAKVAAEVRATSESVMQELSSKVNASAAVLREEAAQATSRIESSVKNSLETYRQQLAQITDTGLEQERHAITGGMADLHSRLRQAAELLAGVDSKVQRP